ncbi:hypothetical protein CC86DRAFT_458191 [Ophiobolus disseminans]|uniref:BTB domain-containing protein n=1 Tax=Ophiobolus disseminans TaxID=1469910 RepID=A0A6A6ZS25_9PLEO|nr:hypothetical protein CC86DRAFT_458191 [Ophiobolus disseminans]
MTDERVALFSYAEWQAKVLRPKLLLVTKGEWFKKAFVGEFSYRTENMSPDNLDYYIGLFLAADKYAYPALEKKTLRIFSVWLFNVIDSMANDESENAIKEFSAIVSTSYDFVDEMPAAPKEAVVRTLVGVIFCHEITNPLGPAAKLVQVVTDTVLKIPEFGADLFREMMRRREMAGQELGRAHLAFIVKVKCLVCDAEWFLATENGELGHCWGCGAAGLLGLGGRGWLWSEVVRLLGVV